MELIGIAADHGGFELKEILKPLLVKAGFHVKDYGAVRFDGEDDYPDLIALLAAGIEKGEVKKGLAVCGSGVGASIVANKFKGVRAALITETYSAHQGVEHDDMNVLCLGGRVIGIALAWEMVEAFLAANYIGGGRFQRRLDKLIEFEQHNFKKIES